MKNAFILFIVLIQVNLSAQGFRYDLYPVDSLRTKWVLQLMTQSKEGAISSQRSPVADSADVIRQMVSMIDAKKQAIENEISGMNEALKRATGFEYSDLKKQDAANEMAGIWEIQSGKDTIEVSVNKSLKVGGGTIRGDVAILDPDTIELKNVLAQSVRLTRSGKTSFRGLLGSNNVLMQKIDIK